MGFPKRKRKGRGTESCRFTTGAIRVEADRHHVTLPRRGTARIMAATIIRTQGRWFVSFACEVTRATAPPRRPWATIGVDVGIRHLAVLSDGRVIPNPAPLLRARRRGPCAADGFPRHPSKGWRVTRRQLVRQHARVANVRHNNLHLLTSELVETYGTIVIERLNVAGLMKNRRLARRLADASLGELRRQLAYKSAWAGSALVEAERFFPSSKTCSGCGYVKAKLPLSEREYLQVTVELPTGATLPTRNVVRLRGGVRVPTGGQSPQPPAVSGWG
jgi:IS605 OrfB family transposase